MILEPVQNSGGCLPPPPGYFQRVREICDRHGVLLISDDTICGWGRLGTWFGAQRFDLVPDLITTAKGLTSAYVPMGAVIASERVAAPFLAPGAQFAHGLTFGGHPVAAAVALANLDVLEGEDLLGHVRRHEPALRARLDALRDAPAGRRRARRGLLLGDRAGRRPGLAPPVRARGGAHPVRRRPRRPSSGAGASSAAPPTAATRSSSSRRR